MKKRELATLATPSNYCKCLLAPVVVDFAVVVVVRVSVTDDDEYIVRYRVWCGFNRSICIYVLHVGVFWDRKRVPLHAKLLSNKGKTYDKYWTVYIYMISTYDDMLPWEDTTITKNNNASVCDCYRVDWLSRCSFFSCCFRFYLLIAPTKANYVVYRFDLSC